jgi:hypothetical protein
MFLLNFTIICTESFAQNSMYNHFLEKSQEYPIYIDTSFENSYYRYISKSYESQSYELSNEQKNKLKNFINIFMLDEEYIYELIEVFGYATFSIENIWIEYSETYDRETITLFLYFYSEEENTSGLLWNYDEMYGIWFRTDFAVYSFSDDIIKFEFSLSFR